MSTKRFKWVDRDTAASDFIQLAYYAPQRIRQRALNLLISFPCRNIISDLAVIAKDVERGVWERRHSLSVMKYIKGQIYTPDFASILKEDFEYQGQFPQVQWSPYHGPTALLALDVYHFVLTHPENIDWFCNILESLENPHYVRDLLILALSKSAETNRFLSGWLETFMQNNHFTAEEIQSAMMSFAEVTVEFEEEQHVTERPEQIIFKYEHSPVWQEFKTLYDFALHGD